MAHMLSAAQLQELKRAVAGDADNTAVCEAFFNAGLGVRRVRSVPYADDRPRDERPGEVASAAEAALVLTAEGTYGAVQQNQTKVLGQPPKQQEDQKQQEDAVKGRSSGSSEDARGAKLVKLGQGNVAEVGSLAASPGTAATEAAAADAAAKSLP